MPAVTLVSVMGESQIPLIVYNCIEIIPRSSPSTVAGTIGFSITSSSSETALLAMPDGASSEDYYNKDAIQAFSAANAVSWYRFINGTLGRRASDDSLYVVTGWDKSTAWGIATVEKHSSPRSLSLQFTAIKAQLGGSYSCSWSTMGNVVARNSVAAEDFAFGPDIKQPKNQCLFLRGFKIKIRKNLLPFRRPSESVKVTQYPTYDSPLKMKNTGATGIGGQSPPSHVASSQGGNQDSADDWSDEEELDPHVGVSNVVVLGKFTYYGS